MKIEANEIPVLHYVVVAADGTEAVTRYQGSGGKAGAIGEAIGREETNGQPYYVVGLRYEVVRQEVLFSTEALKAVGL